MKKLIVVSFAGIFALGFTACGSGESGTNSTNDTSKVPPAVKDTMAVVRPPIMDSSSVQKTMPTSDDNVIMPDSAGHTK
ncbi:hypothetical protein EXU57_20120 [Segetibacter sp. 3557_3]|uniref:hypothetical protein n=1 Tax=Segetibacter sp. 3557_3 TaxID=2547429 RepID=UPI0010585FD3|nr:hypothetical protein [Segetibacter sp. 3557_3]TDH21249.1 hypothetical protein EXU57_20120 [Segetibacter sp. 3557_3]